MIPYELVAHYPNGHLAIDLNTDEKHGWLDRFAVQWKLTNFLWFRPIENEWPSVNVYIPQGAKPIYYMTVRGVIMGDKQAEKRSFTIGYEIEGVGKYLLTVSSPREVVAEWQQL